ncbi:ImmA/IrrE family metallo-endopeptidase [Saccharothrix xinjiangensis]|uniref:ImmA/IrrE family metallo-endopeptidase n=1 Tax=Saccharothrix xinjiangensis TaxID=204798 RepID=A0ABV9XWU3_9PSEU
MTAAHSAVLRLLFDCLDHQTDVVIRRGVAAPNELGDIEFGTNTITVDRTCDFPQFVHTLAHELVHFERGPGDIGDERAEEQRVTEETARLLVPDEVLPSILEAAKPDRLAAELQVDEATVRLAITLTRQEREAAARAEPTTDEGTA